MISYSYFNGKDDTITYSASCSSNIARGLRVVNLILFQFIAYFFSLHFRFF
jgi:hypothetical protein